MSEHITHTAVQDDGARLALHSPSICQAFKITLRKRPDLARMAAMTRSGDLFTVQLLKEARDRWPSRQDGDMVLEKLAYVLGWRCHLAADRTFKPVYRILQPEHYRDGDSDSGPPSDVSVYHDVVVFREIYRNGKEEPFFPSTLDYRMESHPAGNAVAVEHLERLLLSLWQSSLLGMQHFTTAESDTSRWTKFAAGRCQTVVVDVRRYAAAFHSPNPDWLRRYIVEPNFYDRRDPVIALARSLQNGAPDRGIDLKSALEAAPRQSQYAQALERAYRYLQAASDFFERKIDEEELKRLCDVGKPHVPAHLSSLGKKG